MSSSPTRSQSSPPCRNGLGLTLQQAATQDHLWREWRHRRLLALWRHREAVLVHLPPILLTAAAGLTPAGAHLLGWFKQDHGLIWYYSVLLPLLIGIACSGWAAYRWHRKDAERVLRDEW